MRRTQSVVARSIERTTKEFKKKWCVDCRYFSGDYCEKKRVVRECLKKKLKDKE